MGDLVFVTLRWIQNTKQTDLVMVVQRPGVSIGQFLKIFLLFVKNT